MRIAHVLAALAVTAALDALDGNCTVPIPDAAPPSDPPAPRQERRPSAWRSDPLPKRDYDPVAAAEIRARRAAAKARSRAMGHGC